MDDGELRLFNVEGAFVQAAVDEEIHIELPGEYQDVPGAVDRPNTPVYGLGRPRDASTRRCRATSGRRGMTSRMVARVRSASSWKIKGRE